MTRPLRSYLFGALAIGALGLLAGCGGHHFFAEREPWRHEAELQCMNSGAVKEGPGQGPHQPDRWSGHVRDGFSDEGIDSATACR